MIQANMLQMGGWLNQENCWTPNLWFFVTIAGRSFPIPKSIIYTISYLWGGDRVHQGCWLGCQVFRYMSWRWGICQSRHAQTFKVWWSILLQLEISTKTSTQFMKQLEILQKKNVALNGVKQQMLLKYEARQPELPSALNIAQNLKINNLRRAVEWGVHSPALALSRRCTLKGSPRQAWVARALREEMGFLVWFCSQQKALVLFSRTGICMEISNDFFFHSKTWFFKNPTQLDIYGLFMDYLWIVFICHWFRILEPGTNPEISWFMSGLGLGLGGSSRGVPGDEPATTGSWRFLGSKGIITTPIWN